MRSTICLMLLLLATSCAAVNCKNARVTVSPNTVTLASGASQQFTASTSGPTGTLQWSASMGTISAGGYYAAPNVSSTTTVTVQVYSTRCTVGSTATVTINPAVVPQQHSVTLSWTDTDSSVTGYNVYRSQTSGGPYTILNPGLLPSVSYVDLTVTSGLTYYYVVTAVNPTAESGYSGEAAAVIPNP